jgi:hypothetical protein
MDPQWSLPENRWDHVIPHDLLKIPQRLPLTLRAKTWLFQTACRPWALWPLPNLLFSLAQATDSSQWSFNSFKVSGYLWKALPRSLHPRVKPSQCSSWCLCTIGFSVWHLYCFITVLLYNWLIDNYIKYKTHESQVYLCLPLFSSAHQSPLPHCPPSNTCLLNIFN